jgi:hypothetical protein
MSFRDSLNISMLFLKYFIDDYIILIIYKQSPGLSPPKPGLSLDNGPGSSFVKPEPAKAEPKPGLLSPARVAVIRSWNNKSQPSVRR